MNHLTRLLLVTAFACGSDGDPDLRVVSTPDGEVFIDESRTERLPGPCSGEAVREPDNQTVRLRQCTYRYDDRDQLAGLDYSYAITDEEVTIRHLDITRDGDAITSIDRSGSLGDGICLSEEWTFRDDGSTRVTTVRDCNGPLIEDQTNAELASDALEPLNPLDCALLLAARGRERILSLVNDDQSIQYRYDGVRGPGATVERVADVSNIETSDDRDEVVRFTYDDQSRLVEVTTDDAVADGIVDSTQTLRYEDDRLVAIDSDELVYDAGGNLVARIEDEAQGPDQTRVMLYDYTCWK